MNTELQTPFNSLCVCTRLKRHSACSICGFCYDANFLNHSNLECGRFYGSNKQPEWKLVFRNNYEFYLTTIKSGQNKIYLEE